MFGTLWTLQRRFGVKMGTQEDFFNDLQIAKRKSSNCSLIFPTFCFLISTTLFLLLLILSPSDRICISRSVAYKRATEAINYEWVNFGDYFYPSSVYRHASPERDPAWEKLMSRMFECKSSRLQIADIIVDDVISISESELSALQ